NNWKVISKAEALAISNAGLEIFVVYEDTSNSVDHFTAAIGADHAQRALAMAKSLGQPAGSAIYFAVDYDARPADISGPISTYFQAVLNAFQADGSTFKIGVYGGGAVCNHLLAGKLVDYAWLCQSTGFPGYQSFYASKQWALAQKLPAKIEGMDSDPDEP